LEQRSPLPLIWRDLSEKVVVVTGSNTGLGLEASKHFATMNPAKLILAVRDVKKGDSAKEEILKYYPKANIEVRELDLGSFDSVRAFSKKYQDSGNRLDILVSNAGYANSEAWTNSTDGFETALQVNHLANMLLILLLIPVLRKTAKDHKIEPRVLVVASEVHAWTTYPERVYNDPIAALNDPKRSSIKDRYPVTKLLNIFMTRQLARLFPDIVFHSLTPGLCSTELGRDSKSIRTKLFFYFLKMVFARTAEQGSRTLVHAAVSEELSLKVAPNGRYFSSCKETAPTLTARDAGLGQVVWNESLTILSSKFPELNNLFK